MIFHFRGRAPRCPLQSSLRFFALALVSAITTPLVFAQDPDVQKADASPRVDLRVPSPLLLGRTYLAELTVETATQIQDAYVKLSLPYALQIQSGKSYYRGVLPVGSPITISVRFRVSGSPAAPIIGKLVSYDNFGHPTFGKAEILYCKVVEDSIVLSEENPFWETALRLEQKVRTQVPPPLLEVLVEERRRSMAERWTAKETTGPTYTDSLAEAQPISENASVSARLQGVPAAYRFKGHGGDRIWITVEAEDFDPRVLLLRSNGQVVAEDDDGFGPTNARIPAQGVFELASDDSYILVIGSHNQEAKGAYRLRIENFTHLEPSPGVVLQSKGDATLEAATLSQAVDVVLSGQIQYNALTGAAPVRFALVQLFADRFLAVDPVVAISQTDTNGTVSFRVPQANVNDTLYFRVYTRDRDGRIASVEDPLLENVFERRSLHQAEGFRFSLPGSANVTFGTWNLAGTGRNGPFLIFDAAIEGYLIATEILATTLPRIAVVYPIRNFASIFPNPFDTDAHYVNREIFLAVGYETSPDVVLHEYGHFISDVEGFRQTQGGRHVVPFKKRINPSLAWGEGWASFFAVAGQNARGKTRKRNMVSNHPFVSYNYDLEDGHDPAVIAQDVAGDDNEGSVQFILWDLYDNSQDRLSDVGSVDRVSLGLKTVFDVARQGAVLLAVDNSLKLFPIDHLVKFYDGLFQQLPFARTQATPIWNVFADQSIRWERPPAPPTALRFDIVAGALQLRWEAGTGNEVVFEVQRKLPGRSSFDDAAAVSETTYEIPSVTVGTTFRVRANAVNEARFIALLPSNWSRELTYFGPPPSPPGISLSKSELEFSFQIGGTLPSPQSVEITNTGGGTLSWTASSNATWLLASPTRGTAPSLITISVDPTQVPALPLLESGELRAQPSPHRQSTLSAGSYNGTIIVSLLSG